MAATIKSAFDTEATLVEGHNGIYEVSAEGEIIYTNQGQCRSGFPDDTQIIEQIAKHTGMTPKSSALSGLPSTQEQDPSCPLPMADTKDTAADCGCIPNGATSTDGSSCCEPAASNSSEQRTSFIKGLLTGAIIMLALVLAGMSIAKKTGWYEVLPNQSDAQVAAILPVGNDGCSTTLLKDTLMAQLVGQKEAVFAILPCDHQDHTEQLKVDVLPIIKKLQAQGKRTDLVVVEPSSPVYTRLIELHEAESFPSLVVVGTGCASSLLSDNFSEERLFAAFVTATSPVSSSSCSTPCGTQSSDSGTAKVPCCPK